MASTPTSTGDAQAIISLSGKPLAEVAAIVSEHLAARGIIVVIVGGSAITCHTPAIYASDDIDLAVLSGVDRRSMDRALAELGFARRGRNYVHLETQYTVDVVSDTPYIDQRPVQDFATIQTPSGRVRTYCLEDAIADRTAAFLHWNDSQSLDIAERTASAARDRISEDKLAVALDALKPAGADAQARLELARTRLAAALRE